MDKPISTSHLPPPQLQSFKPPRPYALRNETFSNTYSSFNETNISITTDEGDIVTLSASRQYASMLIAAAQTDPYSQTGVLSAAQLESGYFNINIQGDLNDEEIADVQKLIKDIGKIANDFFSGRMDQAINKALNLGDLGSVSQLSATMHRSVAVSTNYAVTEASSASGTNLLDELKTLQEAANDMNPNAFNPMDLLRAQWQQFLEQLDESQIEAKPADNNSEKPANDLSPAQNIMQAAKRILSKHPRLSPLVPAITDYAIDKAVEKHYANPSKLNKLANSLKHNFRNVFRDWILT